MESEAPQDGQVSFSASFSASLPARVSTGTANWDSMSSSVGCAADSVRLRRSSHSTAEPEF